MRCRYVCVVGARSGDCDRRGEVGLVFYRHLSVVDGYSRGRNWVTDSILAATCACRCLRRTILVFVVVVRYRVHLQNWYHSSSSLVSPTSIASDNSQTRARWMVNDLQKNISSHDPSAHRIPPSWPSDCAISSILLDRIRLLQATMRPVHYSVSS